MRSSPSSPDADGLGQVRVDGITRGAFVLRGALAAAAVYGTSAVGPFVGAALGQSDASDAGIVDFALRLERLEAAFYDQALERLPRMSREVRSVTEVIRDDEHEHSVTLESAVKQLGIRPSPPPKLDFGDAFSSERRYLQVAMQLEETGVSAYNGAAPKVFGRNVLLIAAQIVQVEARHAATIRDLLGEDITPGAFDRALTAGQVLQRAKPFIER